jgi:hypothetical protein
MVVVLGEVIDGNCVFDVVNGDASVKQCHSWLKAGSGGNTVSFMGCSLSAGVERDVRRRWVNEGMAGWYDGVVVVVMSDQ